MTDAEIVKTWEEIVLSDAAFEDDATILAIEAAEAHAANIVWEDYRVVHDGALEAMADPRYCRIAYGWFNIITA